MTHFAKSALLIAALSVSMASGISPAIGDEAAAQPVLTTFKSDRGGHTPAAQLILASIASED
ncbi:hypothetical protein SAMN05444004_103284 [Jannaschia faecimaris]|uniref:Uncharacterized protein n=1 Tax=Jannaschia faecimaris TaxID=1244108 RepID=A0A1H3N634_9RHOB|nr:hypothetical protein [Jannaschia faecimaris]SDY84326.1 hypothetical protein SAMN05444004_103284 [Jannaschia faecimaris]